MADFLWVSSTILRNSPEFLLPGFEPHLAVAILTRAAGFSDVEGTYVGSRARRLLRAG